MNHRIYPLLFVVALLAGCALPDPELLRDREPQMPPTRTATPTQPPVQAEGSVPTDTPTLAPSPTRTETPVPTDTPTPAHTPTPVPTDTPTAIHTPTPASTDTPAPPSEELRDQVLATYSILVLTQAGAELLNETAEQLEAGQIDGLQALRALVGLAAVIESVDEALVGLIPPDALADVLRQADAVYESYNELLARWRDGSISPAQVVVEMEALLPQVDAIVREAEEIITSQYGQDPGELAAFREEILSLIQ